jgi:hypothetical protein
VARKTGKLVESEVTELRSAAAAIAADNATLTDANIPPASAFSSQEFDSVLLSAEITGGASPSFTLELLLRDLEAPDGQRWKRLALAKRFGGDDSTPQTTVTLDGTKFVEVLTYGAELIFPRITSVTNAGGTTAWKILARPGARRGALT